MAFDIQVLVLFVSYFSPISGGEMGRTYFDGHTGDSVRHGWLI
jgi:hypothetical protein